MSVIEGQHGIASYGRNGRNGHDLRRVAHLVLEPVAVVCVCGADRESQPCAVNCPQALAFAERLVADLAADRPRDVLVAGRGHGSWWVLAVDVDAGTVVLLRHGERLTVPLATVR